MTLRTRLTLLTFAAVLLALLAFAGVAGTVLWRVELSSITRQVDAQAEALLAIADTTPGRLNATARDILEENGVTATARVYRGGVRAWSGGALGPARLDPDFLNGADTHVVRRAGRYVVASQREGTLSVEVGRSLEPLEKLLRRYALIATLTLLGLSTVVGALVASQVRSALRPLETLAGRVQHLDSAAPLPGLHEPGEVGALARALDRSLQALRAEREHETLFLASASHELRTPVTAMLADVQHTLSRARPAEELRSALERTERTASRLRQLTGNLMTLTRAQRLPTPPQAPLPTVDLLHLAGEAVDLLQPLATRRDLDLWLDGAPVRVQGDSALLGGVLENLVGNAIKFTPPGGQVRVTVQPDGAHAHLTVEDTGPGLPTGALTEAFVRGHTDVEGFGLGLAVVRQVVDAHGGTLRFGQASGGGARVTVALPLEDAAPVAAEQ
ncbi:signal transduction histidine kinase [Deinococcus metalli]|uniref:histidine kinase n=1 Tax=Deinococcus metalli TaxID=1141878 RepID=A0A7W8NNK6_9DEIO|nr:HAMP domain-containing sensor histidine kinase [Deinococcus metalli]MBB5377014.1 signal transduction histidine kinase [Deinococcus metalli]GHF47067.1 two-component sensor histidine kinase [Deinococcus metalli]